MDRHIIPVTYNDQRILTTQQIAEFYGTDDRRISENFNRNKDRYTEGIDFYYLEGDELETFKTSTQSAYSFKGINKLYLWTETGVLMHAKSLNTDQAWAVYRHLVNTYFRYREQPQLTQEPQPTPLQGRIHKVISDDARRKRLIAALNKIGEGHQEVDALLFPEGTTQQTSKPKQIKAADPTASIEDQIIKHLRKHGALTVNALRTSYMKKRSVQEIEWALGGMIRVGIVTSTDTAYGTKKYSLVEAQVSIS